MVHLRGNIIPAKRSKGLTTKEENFSLWDTAIVLGSTSPKRSISGVITAMAIHFPWNPTREIQREAASAEALMLIHSFPTRIEMSKRRGFSKSLCISNSFGCFDSLNLNSLTEPSEKSAVSDPEKKAEKQRRMKMRIILRRIRVSKVFWLPVNGLSI